ncbi:hypothetical protein E4T56_gene10848 [Termitomyces sp. T112]|nr:hypothetical protein E4T56_gene10848 [Termitomyces sp. T112]
MSSKTPSRFQDIRFTVVEIEDPDAPILRILNVHDPLLEPDGSLNVSQILWLRKGDIYMGYTKTEGGRRRGENFEYLIHDGFPRIHYGKLALYLSELPGVVHPALLLLNLTDYKAMLSRRRAGNDIP